MHLLNKLLFSPFCLLTISLFLDQFHYVAPGCMESQDEIEHFFLMKTNTSYWKWIKPNAEPTNVNVSMQINRIAFYTGAESTFDIQVLFELEWFDDRLKFQGTECNSTSPVNFTIEGNEWHYSQMWSPNLRVARNKNPDVLDSKSLSQVMFLRISHTGQIRVHIRSNANLFCPMDYRKYPFDSQTCEISIVSNDLSTDKMLLFWSSEGQITIDDNLFISSHSLESFSASSGEETIREEQFSMLSVKLHFKRQWGHHLLVVFFPSMLIVATSWLSFWVEITSPPARITLCVTTMLALVTVSKEVQQDLPKVPYIKVTCTQFALLFSVLSPTVSIFLSLIEYVIVAYTFRAESKKYKERKKIKRSLSSASLNSAETQTTIAKLDSSSLLSPMESDRFGRRSSSVSCFHRNSLPTPQPPPRIHFTFSPPESPNLPVASTSEIEISQWLRDTPQEVAESIDRKSRILFPFMFGLFNLIYWTTYN